MRLRHVMFILVSLFLLQACGKEEEHLQLTEQDIQETVEANFRTDDGGVILEAQQAIKLISLMSFPCDFVKDTTLQWKTQNFNLIQNISWKVFCDDKVVKKIQYEQTGSWQLDRLFLQAASNTLSNLTITQLTNVEHYIVNGDVFREGQNILTRPNSSREFAHSFSLTFQHVAIRKSNYTIASGKATFQITGKVKDGKEFSEKGDIVFHGDQTATILMQGQSYTISWT